MAQVSSSGVDLFSRLSAELKHLGGDSSSLLNLLTREEDSPIARSITKLLLEAEGAMKDAVEFAVDCTKPFKRMIAECNCKEVDAAITEDRFGVTGDCNIIQKGFLVPITVRMTNGEVTAKLDRLGLQDAGIEHICALAATHSHLVGRPAIAARRSSLQRSPTSHPRYLSLCNWQNRGRELALVDIAGVWAECWHILAIPKIKTAA